MKYYCLVIGLLTLLESTSIEGYITETLYEYSGDVRAGSNFPSQFGSQFGIKANLMTQTEDGSSVIFQFSNVNYQVSTGPLADQEFSKAKFIPAPVESDSLKQPFQVIYKGGKIKSILTMDEPEWSKNLKKSVAAIFQLDVSNLHFNESYSFTTDEDTLHGKCPVGYTVRPKGDGYVNIIKNQEYRKCEDMPQRYFTSQFYEDCPPDNNDDTLLQGSTKYYKLFIGNHKIEIKNIFSQSVTAAMYFNRGADDHTILIRQNLTSLSSETIKESLIFKPKHEMKNLKFVIPQYYNEMGALSDLTGGRDIKSKDEMMEMAHKTLEELVDFMVTMEISKEPEKLNNRLSHCLLFFLGQLDQECLSHCFEKYVNATTIREQNLRETFLQVAAQVGSKASICFIRDVILSNKIPEDLACEINYLVPVNIRDPNPTILKEYKAVLNADVSKKVKKSIILSISNFVFKTYKKYHDEDIINYYADKFYQSFKDDTDYANKLNYLSALTNLEEGKAFDYLVDIANDKTYSSNLRYLALWGTKPEATKNHSKSYKLYWPILTDIDEEIDMRAAAMKLIMITEPTFDRFLSVFWFMQAETNSQLYYFFYTGIESFSNTDHPCYKRIGHYAERLLRYAKKPVTTQLFTGDYIMDYIDNKHTLGGYSMVSLIGDSKTGSPSTIHISQGGYQGGYSNYYFGILVKLSGFRDGYKTFMVPFTKEKINMADLEKILSYINIKPISAVKTTIEIIYYANNHVFATQYLDGNKSTNESKDVGNTSQKPAEETKDAVRKLWSFHKLIFAGVHEFIQPTDIGIPAIWRMAEPYSVSVISNTSKNGTGRMPRIYYDIKIRYGHFGGHSLSFYNPLGGMWQGAHRTISHLYNIPIYGYLRSDIGTYFEFASIRNPESNFNLGVVHHTQTQVFVKDYAKSNGLHESCPTCSPYVTVHSLDNDSKEHNLIEYDSFHTGLKFKLDVFDCDRTNIPDQLASILYEDFDNHDLSPRLNPIARLLHGATKSNTFLEFQPDVGSCGLIFEALPSNKYPYTQMEGDMLLAFGERNEDSMFEKIDKYYLFGSFTLKENDTKNAYQNYSYFVDLAQNYDRINNHLKVELTHNTPKHKDFKICIDAEHTYPKVPHDTMVIRKQSEEEVTGKLAMIWGESSDGKCPTGEIGFKLSMIASVPPTEEIKNTSVHPHSTCHLESNEKEWKSKSLTPVTQACFWSAFEATTLRKFSGDIKYFNITNEYVNYGVQFMKYLQTAGQQIPHVYSEKTDGVNKSTYNEEHHLDGNHGEMKYLIEFEKDKLHMDLHTSLAGYDHGLNYNLNYDKLEFKPYLRSSRFFLLTQIGYDIGFISSCVVTPSLVLTFDNDTYHYKSSNCYTLASADCSGEPVYALFTKKIEGIYDLAVKYYVGGNYLEIIPNADGDFEMNINGNPIPGDLQHGYKYPSDTIDFHYFRIKKNDRFINIDSAIYSITIEYNGHSVSTVIPGLLRGINCGLCGDFNGNKMYNERMGKVCPNADHGVVEGEYLGYRYTNKTEECPEVTEEMMKKFECVEHRH